MHRLHLSPLDYGFEVAATENRGEDNNTMSRPTVRLLLPLLQDHRLLVDDPHDDEVGRNEQKLQPLRPLGRGKRRMKNSHPHKESLGINLRPHSK